MKRTSLTHPLQIAVVSAGPELGRVGITFCPGKYDRHAMTGEWVRDLALDLDGIRDWGAAAVVTLLEPKELVLLRVERLGDEILRRNILWFHLPVVDVSIPDERFEREWLWPVKSCARCYAASSTSWSIAAEGLGVLAR
jgi:ADP-ribosyl-[dinitrogen reductase] hydrolase